MIAKLKEIARTRRPRYPEHGAKPRLFLHRGKRNIDPQEPAVVAVAVSIFLRRKGLLEDFTPVPVRHTRFNGRPGRPCPSVPRLSHRDCDAKGEFDLRCVLGRPILRRTRTYLHRIILAATRGLWFRFLLLGQLFPELPLRRRRWHLREHFLHTLRLRAVQLCPAQRG